MSLETWERRQALAPAEGMPGTKMIEALTAIADEIRMLKNAVMDLVKLVEKRPSW